MKRIGAPAAAVAIPCPIPGCDKQIMEHNLKENRRLERKIAIHLKNSKDEMDDIEVKKQVKRIYKILLIIY